MLGSLQVAEVGLPARAARRGSARACSAGSLEPLLRDRFEQVAVDALAEDTGLDVVVADALRRRRDLQDDRGGGTP